MSDGYIQSGVGSTGTTTDSVTLTGVAAGSTLVAFLCCGSDSAPASSAVADGQGSYVGATHSAGDGANFVFVKPFVLINATAGTHVITGTLPSGAAAFIAAVEVVAAASGAFLGDNASFQNPPGSGTDTISTGTITGITGAATLVGMAMDSASASGSAEPTAGTGFTSRINNANTTIGAYRIETKAVSANAAATWTPTVPADNHLSAAVAILNSAPSTTGALTLTGMAPQRVLGTIITPQTA